MIFQLYVNGMGVLEIAHLLETKGVLTATGAKKWYTSSISIILQNEKYCGDLLQQKTITVDYLTHKRIKNKNLEPQFHIENSHEAIVDRETFYLAQRIRDDRAKAVIGEDKNLAKYTNRYPFSAFIICSECGRTLKRRYWNYGKEAQRVMQQCGGYIDGKAHCKAKATYHEVIEGATIDMLNRVFMKNIDIIPIIKRVIYSTVKAPDVQPQIKALEIENEKLELALSNLVDMKIKYQTISEELFNSKYMENTLAIKDNNEKISKLEDEFIKHHNTLERLKTIDDVLQARTEPLTEVDETILKSFIYKMISVKPDEIVFCIAGSTQYSEKEFSERRHEFEAKKPIFESVYIDEQYQKEMKYRVVVI